MRNCKDCEYFRQAQNWHDPRCHLNPPVLDGKSHGRFPIITEIDFCSKWEPKWDDNPVMAEAWELFQMTTKLAK